MLHRACNAAGAMFFIDTDNALGSSRGALARILAA
jgi:hypothetical protein